MSLDSKTRKMLEQITWNEYLTTLFYFLVVYYLVVVLFFYKREISRLLERSKSATQPAKPQLDTDISDSSKKMVNIIAEIFVRSGQGANKDVLLTELRVALSRYEGMRIPAYRNAILDYIIREARQVCGVELNVRELER